MSEEEQAGSGEAVADEILSGEHGYWQHWWNMLHDPSTQATGRLDWEIVVPAVGAFASRSWHTELDRDIRNYALDGARIGGRVIVPPAAVGSAAEPLIQMALEHDFEVRILSSPADFAIYNGAAAVLTEQTADGEERHRLTRQPSTVTVLVQFFESLWTSAVGWQSAAEDDGDRILELLARGWTDERIAGDLGVSTRTVNRRVAELMRSVGAQSRFSLGMRIAPTGLGRSNSPSRLS
ncbi:MAG: helix-turn-helix domain-containing protein [Leucobacter sp.]